MKKIKQFILSLISNLIALICITYLFLLFIPKLVGVLLAFILDNFCKKTTLYQIFVHAYSTAEDYLSDTISSWSAKCR